MKTSVIEVRDMLSVLTVDAVEKRIGEAPGVKSATVNYAAGNATVRFDETLLDVADIKVLAHQRGQQPKGDPQAGKMSLDGDTGILAETSMPDSAPALSRAPAAPAVKNEEDEPEPDTTAPDTGMAKDT